MKNYEDGKTNLSPDDALLFKEWKLSFNQSDMMKLAMEGENEMIDLAERYQTRFPSLMPEIYNNETYRVCMTKYFILSDFCVDIVGSLFP